LVQGQRYRGGIVSGTFEEIGSVTVGPLPGPFELRQVLTLEADFQIQSARGTVPDESACRNPVPVSDPDAAVCEPGAGVEVFAGATTLCYDAGFPAGVVTGGPPDSSSDGARPLEASCSTSARGDAGNDRIRGGSGEDRLFGATGADALFGESGSDDLRGGVGPHRCEGGSGGDRLRGCER
jgi:hypothetical protein